MSIALTALTAAVLAFAAIAGCISPSEEQGAQPGPSSVEDRRETPGHTNAEITGQPKIPDAQEARRISVKGTSRLTAAGACPDPNLGCVGAFDFEWGEFSAEGDARDGFVNVTWTPSNPIATQLHVFVRGKEVVGKATGASPLSIVLESPIARGDYLVGVLPAPPGGAMLDQTVQWEASFMVYK